MNPNSTRTSSSMDHPSKTPSFMEELRSFDKGGFFDLGHPLLNRVADSFITAAGIGAVQAVSREAYFTAFEGVESSSRATTPEISGGKRNRFPSLRGETNGKSLEAMVKNTGKESIQWGLAAGLHSGLTYGLKEARGTHDWKNSMVAGVLTGVALAPSARAGGALRHHRSRHFRRHFHRRQSSLPCVLIC